MMSATERQRQEQRRKQKYSAQQRQKWVLSSFAVGVTLIVFLMIAASSGAAQAHDFTATTVSGDALQLSDYRGQVVMLNFWATWCPPCKAEMPTIEAAYEQYRDQGFVVLAINASENLPQIQPFVSKVGLQFPVLLDTDSRLQKLFNVDSYPTSIFISPTGEIYHIQNGMLNDQQIVTYINTGLTQLKTTST